MDSDKADSFFQIGLLSSPPYFSEEFPLSIITTKQTKQHLLTKGTKYQKEGLMPSLVLDLYMHELLDIRAKTPVKELCFLFLPLRASLAVPTGKESTRV